MSDACDHGKVTNGAYVANMVSFSLFRILGLIGCLSLPAVTVHVDAFGVRSETDDGCTAYLTCVLRRGYGSLGSERIGLVALGPVGTAGETFSSLRE